MWCVRVHVVTAVASNTLDHAFYGERREPDHYGVACDVDRTRLHLAKASAAAACVVTALGPHPMPLMIGSGTSCRVAIDAACRVTRDAGRRPWMLRDAWNPGTRLRFPRPPDPP